MAEISLGNLYDMNKEAMKNQKPLNNSKLDNRLLEVAKYFNTGLFMKGQSYWMLLCREQNDYTLFKLSLSGEIAVKELKICLRNRGDVTSIEYIKETDAYEIWITIDSEAYCYYLFNYDKGVIEV